MRVLVLMKTDKRRSLAALGMTMALGTTMTLAMTMALAMTPGMGV